MLLEIAQYLSLPDGLALLAVSTALRAKLLPALAKQLLPAWARPSEFEMSSWNALLAAERSASAQSHFPWLSYASKCFESPSMRNRARIWGIYKQV